ncbi:UPF0715 family protein [Bacillus weihaiensis]|uniref:UPF0715 family protein n=1 Tax=Bacillus weihaiensis TaxID=1547283 RepID=UPI0034DEAD40
MVYLLPYCFLTLVVSSLLFSLVLSIPKGEYLYFLLLSSMTVIPFYCVVIYSLFTIPLQFYLSRNPKKFAFHYLVFYTLCSFLAVCAACIVVFNGTLLGILKMEGYYKASFFSAILFWFCDSIFLQSKKIS